ncbi:MAG: hypothetical protein QM703_18820 [Gemmatales bacterium]
MSTTLKTLPVEAKKRGGYRRLLLVTAVVIFGSVASWMIWGAVRDWADARALEAYFAELEKREPGWQDRVYGKALTSAQMDDHQKWGELEQAITANTAKWPVWMAYRQGLSTGMYQDPALPAAHFPPEQVEFLKAAHEYWQPTLKKLSTQGKLPGQHRFLDRNASYEQMLIQASNQSSNAYLLNEGVEMEVMYYIMMNDAEQAFRWFSWRKPPTAFTLNASPFLIERWLNLTQPQGATLLQMQKALEGQSHWLEKYGLPGFGTDLRLLEKHIRELAHGELTSRQIDDMGELYGFYSRDSAWKSSLLNWLRPYYVKYRLGNVFQRSNNIVLKLHQMADQVEGLAAVEPARQWASWKSWAEAQSILINRDQLYARKTLPNYSDGIPEGLFLLRARYAHSQVLSLFETEAQMRTALAAVVAERFRVDQGRFPKDWAELVPKYIDQPILDPFTGKPLMLKLNEKGIVIYSVGGQGKDEGGEKLNHNHYWNYGGKGWDVKNSNLGTRVLLPALRRGPAAALTDDQRQALTENTGELLKLMKKGEK